ncbi:MAG: hypothetical protein IPF80_04915 [Thermomonas sp.]|nr:hypothetical protein [Thermomonas sp.]
MRVKIWKRKEKVLMDSLGKAYESGSNTDAIEIEIVEHGKSKPEEPKEIKRWQLDVTITGLRTSWSSRQMRPFLQREREVP